MNVGDQVVAVRGVHAGKQGVIVAILPGGRRTPVTAEIRLPDGQIVFASVSLLEKV